METNKKINIYHKLLKIHFKHGKLLEETGGKIK